MKEFKPPINIDDAVLEKFPWGEIRWIWNAKIDADAEQTLGQVIIYPGKKNTTHTHTNCEELMYILEGECDQPVKHGKSLSGEVGSGSSHPRNPRRGVR